MLYLKSTSTSLMSLRPAASAPFHGVFALNLSNHGVSTAEEARTILDAAGASLMLLLMCVYSSRHFLCIEVADPANAGQCHLTTTSSHKLVRLCRAATYGETYIERGRSPAAGIHAAVEQPAQRLYRLDGDFRAEVMKHDTAIRQGCQSQVSWTINRSATVDHWVGLAVGGAAL